MARTRPSLAKLREHRVPKARDAALAGEIETLRADLARRRRGGGGAAAAWDRVVPVALRDRSEVVGLSNSVLIVRVRDAAARFSIDRFLRAGGEAALVKDSPVAVRRVKLVS